MLRNNLLIALRHLRRRAGFSSLNILGMALGLACSLILINYLVGQYSVDRFHADSDRIFRVISDMKIGTSEDVFPNVPPRVGYDLQETMPEVELSTRFHWPGTTQLRIGDRVFEEGSLYAADSMLLQMFDFPLLEGNPETALKEANRMLLTPRMAEKYFPERVAAGESVVGETLLLGEERTPFMVEGIIVEPPTNSHIQFEILTSMASWRNPNYFMWSYVWANTVTYVRLRNAEDMEAVNDKIPAMIEASAEETARRVFKISFDELKARGDRFAFYLQPMEEVYLHSAKLGNQFGPVGNIQFFRIFVAVAIFIIGIACINFMNLSTAQAGQRAKEVGIRKTLGSAKGSLRRQFLLETLLYCLLAFVLSLGLYELLLMALNQWVGVPLMLGLSLWQRVSLMLGLTLLMALMAGLYPAYYLTRFRPIEALKGKLHRGRGAAQLRNGLVVLQFSISIAMIISTLVVYKQWQYARAKDLGFDREQVIMVRNTARLGDGLPAFMDEVRKLSGVNSAAVTSAVPGINTWGDFWHAEGNEANITMWAIQADEDYAQTLNLQVEEGRYFDRQFRSDSAGIVLNRAAVEQYGLTDPVIGKRVMYSSPFPGQPTHYTVIGVVQNFHTQGFGQQISPVGILLHHRNNLPISPDIIAVRYQPEKTGEVLSTLEGLWQDQHMESAFEYNFLDESFGQLFQTEKTMSRVFGVFSGLTIFIACLGLFGLAAFTAERRTKEVGVRKVLGASELQLLNLLNGHFVKLVLIAFVLGGSVAALGMQRWLQGFVYRTTLSPWIFLIGGISALAIAWATVSFQSWRVARLNPVESLRDE